MALLLLFKYLIYSILFFCVAFQYMPIVTVLPLCNPDNFCI